MYRAGLRHFRRMSDNCRGKPVVCVPIVGRGRAKVTLLSVAFVILSLSCVPVARGLHSQELLINLTGNGGDASAGSCSELERLIRSTGVKSVLESDRETTEREFVNEPEVSQVSPMNPMQNYYIMYQRKIAYAQKLAFCFTLDHSEIPKVESRSQLIKNAECRPNSACEKCILKIKACEKNDWRLTGDDEGVDDGSLEMELETRAHQFHSTHPIYSAIEIENKSPKLAFHCYRPGPNGTFEAYFKMEYEELTTLDKITEQDTNLVPRIFVVEKMGAGPRKIEVTTSWLFPYEKVKRYNRCRIRVTPVSPTIVFKTLEISSMTFLGKAERVKSQPTNVSVIYDDQSIGTNSTDLLIRWKSGTETNASCNSNVFFLDDDDDDYRLHVQKEPQEAFWTTISKKLNYGKNYTIRIIEKFEESESNMELFIVHVPTCFEVYNYSFKHCAPPKVENLTVKSKSVGSLYFSWDSPPHTTENNTVSFYNLTISRAEVLSPRNGAGGTGNGIPPLHSLQKSVYSANVHGNEAYWSFQSRNGTFKGKIHVSIQSFSEGGKSELTFTSFDLPSLGKEEGLFEKIWVAAVVIVCVILIIMVLFWLKNYRDKLQRKKQLHEYFEKLDKESIEVDPAVDKYSSKWEISSGALVLGDVIGEGAFGLVRKALLYKNGQKLTVAVKTLRDGVDEKDSGKFWEEFNILKGLDPHMHVVGLVGIVKIQFPALVVEYCHGGDLQTHLRKASQARANQQVGRSSHSRSTSTNDSSTSTLNNEVKVRMSMVTNEAYFLNKFEPVETVTELDLLSYSRQISCGMEFLSTNKIVHRDLAARNVLIGPNRTLKIADFGLSRDVYEQNWYKKNSNGKIPIKWLAIECLLQEVYTTKSDVWSYGILLWEIVTFGGNPYPGVENTRIFDMLKSGYRMPQPENCSDELYTLMCQCWQERPVDRPDFASIKHRIDHIIEKSNFVVYMNLDHGAGSDSSSTGSQNNDLD